jgi:DNA topoisomerase VI subunit B
VTASTTTLTRHVFKTSRLIEFCSEKELVNQTGHSADDWPLVGLKELVDNALDAAEEAGTPPEIEIVVSRDGISISDNEPGIAADVVADILEFTSRTSSREAYVSPTRGAQGHALKTIIAMPFPLGESGETAVIESRGVAHRISFSIDPIKQTPKIDCANKASLVKKGTRVSIAWPNSACSILDDARERFLQVVENYSWLNPHLTLSLQWNRGGEKIRFAAAASPTARGASGGRATRHRRIGTMWPGFPV